MKLQTVITQRLLVVKAVMMALWAVAFYFAIVIEINDETDDSLRNYAETLIQKYLAGERLPEPFDIYNNRYMLNEVTEGYANSHQHINYSDRTVYIAESDDYEPARTINYIFMTDGGQYIEAVVYTPTIDKSDLKRAIAVWLVVLYALLLAGMIVVNVWTLHRSMRPLYRLLRWLDGYKLGTRNAPLPAETKIEEFRRLTEAVRSSTERNEQIYGQQKLFIGNASHEMQTPLAVCQNRLEMLLDDDSLSEEQMEQILKTLRSLRSLSHLNRGLLLLCKIENGQYAEAQDVNLTGEVERVLEDCKLHFAAKHIKVETRLNVRIGVNMNLSLARMLVGNLVRNAFIHNKEGGEVTIESRVGELRIENTGRSGALDSKRIFECFYHDGGTGTGLGLALVRTIAQVSRLQVRYGFSDGRHVFVVSKRQ